MMANPTLPGPNGNAHARRRQAVVAAGLALLALLSGCAPVPPASPPPPAPPIAPPPPPPVAAPQADWRDAPLAPGQWRWSPGVASFAGGPGARMALSLACQGAGASARIRLRWSGPAASAGPTPVVITTSTGTRRLLAPAIDEAGLQVDFAPRDATLDAMVFTRGRWMIDAAGAGTMILPSGPEIGRVIDDCRK
ncbi:MAG TPA: hypothetical protein VN222_08165 [Novosphingobium sp.]|nr:hypothetical protein [Novosphingobium sp.]